jgi:16S rRNA processing protein RimM
VPGARVMVGVIVGAHGVRGAVRVKPFTAEPASVAAYGPVEDETGTRRFELRLVGAGKGVVIATLKGVEDRNAAEALKGLRLYVARAALPAPAEEEFYHADLIGLEAVTRAGTALGRVRAVHDFGAGDSLEIALGDGGTFLIPFTKAAVPEIDIAGGTVVVDPPDWLSDTPPPLAGEGRVREGAVANEPRRMEKAAPPPSSPLPRKRARGKASR